MSWNSGGGGGADQSGRAPNAPQHYLQQVGGVPQQGGMILQQVSPTRQQQPGGFVGVGYQQPQQPQQQQQQQQQQGSQQVYISSGMAPAPTHQQQGANVTQPQQQPQMVTIATAPPGAIHPQAWAAAGQAGGGGGLQPAVVYSMQAPSRVQLPVHPWQPQQPHFQQDPQQPRYQPEHYYRGSPQQGGRGGWGGRGHGGGAGRGSGASGRSIGSGVGSLGGWGAGGAAVVGGARGDKKRERGEELELKGRGKGKATSKGGAKASRREADGGRVGQGMPAPSSGSVVGSARGSVVGSARGSRSGSVASASDAADGVPYANSRHPATTQSSSESSASPNPNNMKRVKKKSKNGHASRGVYAPPPAAAAGPPRRPVAVSNVDRAAGVGHWTNLMHSAGNVDPIELNPAKRAAAGAVAAAPGKKGGEGARSVPPPPAPVVEPPKPMKEFPPGSGKMVLDELAHARMYPGGAVLNMKSFKLKQKSAVSAAFEMCAAMEPKSRPSFENKNKDAAKNISPFTLNVSVNGVAYSPATAKNTKLAKQLASINFLREAVGTREQLDLESLIAETTGGSLAGSAAIAAAISQGKPATGAGAGGGAKGGAKGSRGGGGASDGGGGSGKGTEGSATGTDNDDDPVAKHALGDGLQNYAQLLHDLVAAHPETPNYASYMFRALKDNASQQKSKLTGKGFRCFARLLRHVVDPVETAKRKEVEAAKSAIEVAAKASLGEDPENEALKEAAREAHKDFLKHRAIPKLSIGVLSAEGDGANKRDAKHKAAQGLMYALMPKCKTDEDLRSQAKVVIEKYQAEKKVRMEKEQKAAQEAKRAREAAKKAKKAGAAAGRATAAASRVPAADPSAAIPHPETRGDRAMLNALTAAVKSAEDRRASEASLAEAGAGGGSAGGNGGGSAGDGGGSASDGGGPAGDAGAGAGAGAGAAATGVVDEGGDAAGEEGSGASEAVPMAVAEDDGADDASAPADAAGVPADETGVTADANGGSANANGVPADANGVPADANGAEETPAVVVPAPAPASAAIVRSASTASAPVAGGRPGTRATRATAAAGVAAVTAAPAETAADGGEADA